MRGSGMEKMSCSSEPFKCKVFTAIRDACHAASDGRPGEAVRSESMASGLCGPTSDACSSLTMASAMSHGMCSWDSVSMSSPSLALSMPLQLILRLLALLQCLPRWLPPLPSPPTSQVEAYLPDDSACHARFGCTARTAPLVSDAPHRMHFAPCTRQHAPGSTLQVACCCNMPY